MYKPRWRQNRDGTEREDGGGGGRARKGEKRESSEGGAEREKELSRPRELKQTP